MFKVRFLKAAQEDYDALDGSQKKWVETAIERLTVRRGELGEPLHKFPADDLRGCKKLKNRSLGLRIVFRIISPFECEVIEIIVIGKRCDSEVYLIAGKRLQAIRDQYNQLPTTMLPKEQQDKKAHLAIYKSKTKKKKTD